MEIPLRRIVELDYCELIPDGKKLRDRKPDVVFLKKLFKEDKKVLKVIHLYEKGVVGIEGCNAAINIAESIHVKGQNLGDLLYRLSDAISHIFVALGGHWGFEESKYESVSVTVNQDPCVTPSVD